MRWIIVLATILLALVLFAVGLKLREGPVPAPRVDMATSAPREVVPTVAPPALTETLSAPDLTPLDWLLTGRVRFSGFPHDPRDVPVLGSRVSKIHVAPSRYNAPSWEVDLQESGLFRRAVSHEELGVAPDAAGWEVRCSIDALHPGADGAVVTVPVNVDGHVVDFGEVVIAAEEFFAACNAGMGCLIHSSGLVFSYSGPYRVAYAGAGEETLHPSEEFCVGVGGEFLATFYAAPPADACWWLLLCENALERADSPGRIAIAAPERRSGLLDFGELRVPGPLLEITCNGDGLDVPTSPRGAITCDVRGEYRGDAVEIEFENVNEDVDVTGYPSLKVRRWITPGRWSWRASVRAPGYYSDLAGAVHAMEDRVYPMHLEFTRFVEIPYTVIGNREPLDFGAVTWRVFKDGNLIASGEPQQGTVPVSPGTITHVSVRQDGYEPGEAQATSDMTGVTVELTPLAMFGTTLTVSLPPMPEGIWVQDTQLVAEHVAGDDRAAARVKLGKQRKEHVFAPNDLPSPGLWRVFVRGGGDRGYPYSGMSGAVEVELVAGEAAFVELPDIGAPPWKHRARWMNTWMECEGNSFMWSGPQKYGEGGVHDNDPYGWLPTGLPDGDEFANAKITLPQKDGDNAQAFFDLEARVKVGITVRGESAKSGYWLTLVSETRYGRGTIECPASGQWTSMWAPQGEATLTVRPLSGESFEPVFERKLNIRKGHVELVEVDLNLVEVVFKGGYFTDERAHLRDDPNWGVVRVDVAQPYLVDSFSGEVGRQEETALLPGVYRVVPLTSDPNNYVEFDVTDGVGRTITLPTLGPLKLGTCELLFDTDLLGIGEVEVELYWRPACDTPALRELRLPMDDVKAEPGPRGLTVSGVPAGFDIFLCGTVRIETRQGEKALMLNPVRLRQGESEIEVGWTKTRRLSERVLSHWIGIVSMVEGQWLPFGYDYNYVPVGTHQVALLDRNNRPAGRMQVDVPDALGDFEVPEDFRRELIRLGLLGDGPD